MSVLFIVHDLYQEDNPFPLNIGYLSAVLVKQGFDVEIFNMDILHYTKEDLATVLKLRNFDLIGISFLAARFTETILPLCKVINRYKKDAWLVLGGHGPSPIPKFMLKETGADIICIGEAEETILGLIYAKQFDLKISSMKGIAYFEKLIPYKGLSKITINECRKPIKNLDSIPFPQWDLFPMETYSNNIKFPGMERNDKLLPIITSRGCINKCSFCYRMEDGIRFRSMENVVEEMVILNKDYGITYFNICDELFGYPKKRVFEFQDELEKRDLKINYFCAVRVDTVDKEVLQSLKESGCKFINFGFESSSQEVLDLMNKHTTIEQNIEAIELSREMGFETTGLNFIWGNKGDTEKTLWDNVDLIKKYQAYSQLRTIRPVTPYPGCQLYYDAIAEGKLEGPKDFFDKFKNSDLITVNFTEYSLEKCYDLLYKANMDLITDYALNTPRSIRAQELKLIQNFYELYFEGKTNFRGARHYGKK